METNVYYDRVDFQCLDQIEHQTNNLLSDKMRYPPAFTWLCMGSEKASAYHMHFILEGSGYFEINHQIHHLKQGQIFLIPPDTVSRYYPDSQNPWTYAFISFQGNKSAQYIQQAGFGDCPYIRDCVKDPEIYVSIIREMLKTHQLTITNELKRIVCSFSSFPY